MFQALYSSTIGSLMYAVTYSYPNLSYVVSIVIRYMMIPSKGHWKGGQFSAFSDTGVDHLMLVYDLRKLEVESPDV